MSSVLAYEGIKFEKGSVTKVTDLLPVESALQININGKSYTVVMQTPGAEEELATGLLYAEDVIKTSTPLHFDVLQKENNAIRELNVKIDPYLLGKGYLNSRSLLSVSSCGICGKQELDDIKVEGDRLTSKERISVDALFKMQSEMRSNQVDFDQTGGSHAAAAFDLSGNLLALYEDIGRHNALDKVVGGLIRKQELQNAKILSFSGRISYEVISKAFRAKIPIVFAVSAPSSLSIDFAKEYGMTLLGFCRDNKANCYANAWRIND